MTKITDQLEILKRLNHFSQGFGIISTFEHLATSVSEVLDDLLDIESSGLYLYDFQEKRLKLLFAKGFSEEERAEADKTAMERHPGLVFKTGKILHIPDTENDPSNLSMSSKRSFQVRSRLYIPVLNGTEPVGAFGIVSSRKDAFNEECQIILSFICNIAGGIYAYILHNAEQKEAHDRLASIKVRLETLIRNLQSGILVEDQDRKIALINQAFCDMFGIPVQPEHLFGADCTDSAEQSKGLFADPQKFVNRIENILKEKLPVTGEELDLANGRTFERDYIPIFLEGRFLGNLWQYRDTTARVMIEKNLRKAIDDARSANSAKSTFLANMSHEIRTPLNAVIGLSRLMKDTRLNPEQTVLNDKLLISGENLLNIINEILDFSKIEAGRVELEKIPFNLQTIFDRVYSFLSHAAEEKAITLSAMVEAPFLKAVIGDPVRLQQVLINLVNNAIKFTSEGGIDLSCSLVNESENKATFIFSVTDSGIGISEENLQNIFEKFKQEDESVTRVYGGTGLGLAISRQLVGLMGGELQVTSRKGIGSRFFFTVEFETTEKTLLNEVNRKIYLDPDALKGKNILVVEDNEFNQFIARSILLKWNTNTDLAANGREAIEKVGEKNYDLILMDMQMPVMDGLTATRILRKEFNIKTPIIALTAFATTEAIGKAMDAGMIDYLTKPFEEESLFGKLMAAFGIPLTYIPSAETASQDASAIKSRQNPQFDLTKLSRLLGDDRSEIIDLIEKFIELTPDYSSALYDAFKQNNIEEIARTSHKIKSSLELLASGNLRSNIKLINEYASSGTNLDKLPSLMKYYQENITKLMQQLAEKNDEMRKALPPS